MAPKFALFIKESKLPLNKGFKNMFELQQSCAQPSNYGTPQSSKVCMQNQSATMFRGIVKEEYLMIIMGKFSPVLHKNICCGYSFEVPCQGNYKHVCLCGDIKKLSQNYHQIHLNLFITLL